jgi:hypothetical protein
MVVIKGDDITEEFCGYYVYREKQKSQMAVIPTWNAAIWHRCIKAAAARSYRR